MPPNLVLLTMEIYMNEDALKKAWSDHSRLWEKNIWVYPVISRRAEGLSIGVNLNLDKHCTFSCVYCQVDRTVPGPKKKIDIDAIDAEIESIFAEYEKNGLASFANFKDVPAEKRRVKDISLSGDGESTIAPEFTAVCKRLREIQERHPEHDLQLTLITNATMLDRDNVREGLKYLTGKKGEIWAKLDAGTDAWYKKVDRSHMPLGHVQENIESTVKDFPLRVQTLFCEISGERPSDQEIGAYVDRIERIYRANPKNLLGIQLYDVIRHTAAPHVLPLGKPALNAIADKLRARVPVTVKVY